MRLLLAGLLVLACVAAPSAVAGDVDDHQPGLVDLCVPVGGTALCATCGYIGFDRGFHFDTQLLC